jgi:hypothetical protein
MPEGMKGTLIQRLCTVRELGLLSYILHTVVGLLELNTEKSGARGGQGEEVLKLQPYSAADEKFYQPLAPGSVSIDVPWGEILVKCQVEDRTRIDTLAALQTCRRGGEGAALKGKKHSVVSGRMGGQVAPGKGRHAYTVATRLGRMYQRYYNRGGTDASLLRGISADGRIEAHDRLHEEKDPGGRTHELPMVGSKAWADPASPFTTDTPKMPTRHDIKNNSSQCAWCARFGWQLRENGVGGGGGEDEEDEEDGERATPSVSMSRCSKCKLVEYCCREHQLLHWKTPGDIGHKKICKEEQQIAAVKKNRVTTGPFNAMPPVQLQNLRHQRALVVTLMPHINAIKREHAKHGDDIDSYDTSSETIRIYNYFSVAMSKLDPTKPRVGEAVIDNAVELVHIFSVKPSSDRDRLEKRWEEKTAQERGDGGDRAEAAGAAETAAGGAGGAGGVGGSKVKVGPSKEEENNYFDGYAIATPNRYVSSELDLCKTREHLNKYLNTNLLQQAVTVVVSVWRCILQGVWESKRLSMLTKYSTHVRTYFSVISPFLLLQTR